MKKQKILLIALFIVIVACLGMGCKAKDAAEAVEDQGKTVTSETAKKPEPAKNLGGEVVSETETSNNDTASEQNSGNAKTNRSSKNSGSSKSTQVYDPETGKDQYGTEAIPAGKPTPVEPENQEVDKKKSYTCTLYIACTTILDNMVDFNQDKLPVLPSDGVIYKKKTVTFYEGESVFDVLQRECVNNNIHMEFSWTPIYNSHYVEGIGNLYEFDCGSLSGWMFSVNGWFPNYGCSRYVLSQGDEIEWLYTCDLGRDIGDNYLANSN